MRIAKGDVVIVDFPFSDLSGSKWRPAFVAALTPGTDVVLCQMTSRLGGDRDAIRLDPSDLDSNKLRSPGMVRPSQLFTGGRTLVRARVGAVNAAKRTEITDAIVAVLRR